jgi:cob(I)alamin adenosyltransferase
MVRLSRIYTRTGDDGTTGLVGNQRRSKADARIEAIGSVDELNAAVGLARLETTAHKAIDEILARVQNDLFDLGADLATPAGGGGALRVAESQVERLETEIDGLNGDLAPLRSFVLPGGTAASAALHFARTLARRAERSVVRLGETSGENVGPVAARYLNRLSDLLFVAARWTNDKGAGDVLWVPGQNR